MAELTAPPECFGSPCVARGSPCVRCRLLGPCVDAVNADTGLGGLVWPRIAQCEAPDVGPAPAVTPFDEESLASLVAFMQSASMTEVKASTVEGQRLRNVWKYRREAVLCVEEANAARTVLHVCHYAPETLMALPASKEGVQFAPWVADHEMLPSDRLSARPALPRLGTVATFVTADTARAFIAQLLRRHFPDAERERE